MLTARRIHRPAVLCALACALLGSTLTGTAAGQPANHTRTAAAIAQEGYYSSYGKPVTIDARSAAGQAQERYYSSYGEAEPLTLPQPGVPSDQTPWPAIAMAIAAALTIVAVSANQLRRFRIRRRGARAVA
jgi:hypothetical protein